MDNRSNLKFVCRLLKGSVQDAPGQTETLQFEADANFSWPGVVAIAADHCVLPALYSQILRQNLVAKIEPDMLEYLWAVHDLNAARNRELRSAISSIAARLDRAGINFVFLKGTANLLHDVYVSPADRFMRDIDILVESSGLSDTAAMLKDDGFDILPRPWSHEAFYAVDGSGKTLIEVHRAILPDRRACRVPAERFLESRISVPGMAHAYTPCASHMLLHNAAHAMLSDDYYRLAELPLKDAYDFILLAERFAPVIDWASVSNLNSDGRPDRGGRSVMAFYVNEIRRLFGMVSLPGIPGTFESSLTKLRWRMRRGTPLDISAAHTGRRNLREGLWRYITVPLDRSRINSAIVTPSQYKKYAARLLEISRRQAGRFS